jgi:hypothetical protein
VALLRRDLADLEQHAGKPHRSVHVHPDFARALLVRCALLGVVPRPEVFSLLWVSCEPEVGRVAGEELGDLLWATTSLHQVGWVGVMVVLYGVWCL